MRVLITGGTGLIGNVLIPMLLERGYDIALLSRNPKPMDRISSYAWNIEKGTMDLGALDKTDYIIHLAGAGIADRLWSQERKKEIIDSRTQSIRLIYQNLKKLNQPIKACISSGGIGYYGNRGDELLKEESDPGIGFLPQSCIEWERAVSEGNELDLRITQFRVGMVLSRKGGGLKPLEKLSSFSVISPIGDGTQFISWIHIQDLCRMFIKAIESSEIKGIYNAVAPNPVRNREFTLALAKAMHRYSFLPSVPNFLMKTILGEMSSIILDSTRVSSEKIQHSDFEFQFKTIEKAFLDLYPN